MRRALIKLSMFMCLMAAIGAADKGHFALTGILSIWPVFVLIANLVDDIRRYGW